MRNRNATAMAGTDISLIFRINHYIKYWLRSLFSSRIASARGFVSSNRRTNMSISHHTGVTVVERKDSPPSQSKVNGWCSTRWGLRLVAGRTVALPFPGAPHNHTANDTGHHSSATDNGHAHHSLLRHFVVDKLP